MEAILVALRAVCGVVVLDVLLDRLQPPGAFPRRLTQQLTAPLYWPIQRVFDPARTGVDFSPMVVVMAIIALGWLIAPEAVSAGH